MIEQLLELIKITNSKGEYSQIATGKNKIPETFKELYNHLKYLRK